MSKAVYVTAPTFFLKTERDCREVMTVSRLHTRMASLICQWLVETSVKLGVLGQVVANLPMKQSASQQLRSSD